jgi:cytochrome c oxidase assembly protein subunit 15
MELPVAVSVAHGTLGQVFFVLVVLAALTTSQGWRGPAEGTVRGRRLTVAFFAAAFLQLILGAWMRHEGAGLAIPDFPLAMGRVVPPLDTFPVALHFAHRTWAVVVALLGVVTASRLLGVPATASRLRLPASALLGLLALQIGLGGAVVLTLRSVVTTTSHVAVGALILATAAVLALEANRTALPSRRVEGRDDSREIACELAGGGVAP